MLGDYGQPETRPGGSGGPANEWLEHLLSHIGREPRTEILDIYEHSSSALTQTHSINSPGVQTSIDEQVGQDSSQVPAIDGNNDWP
jgi:hypothetical protein